MKKWAEMPGFTTMRIIFRLYLSAWLDNYQTFETHLNGMPVLRHWAFNALGDIGSPMVTEVSILPFLFLDLPLNTLRNSNGNFLYTLLP